MILLHINKADFRFGIEFDLDVRRDAVILDFPLAFGPENRPTRGGDEAAVY